MPHPPLSFRSFQSGAGARFFALPGNAVPDGAVQFVEDLWPSPICPAVVPAVTCRTSCCRGC